jgi:flagellar biosynthesis protein FlhB
MAEQEQNRNEAATPFKLEEARKRGAVPKSIDANSLLMLLAAVLGMHFWGSSIAGKEMHLFQSVLSNAHHFSFETDGSARMLAALLGQALGILAPVFVLLAVFAVLSNLAQTGPVFSFVPLKPNPERINPVAGFKRLFSMRLLMESAKTVLKFLLLGAVLYEALRQLLPVLIATQGMDPASIGHLILPEANSVLVKLLATFAFIAVLDLAFSRWEYARRLRMSRREIREEIKRREGDPRIKARLRELQREAVKRARSLGRVKDADVLIVNPVRLAVAIKYDKEQVDAPLVIAKGAGFLAGRMRELARRANVPVVQNKPLARALFHSVGIDQPVPPDHYGALARILLWAFAIRDRSTARERSA